MNVTKDGIKDRQLHIEDYLQRVTMLITLRINRTGRIGFS